MATISITFQSRAWTFWFLFSLFFRHQVGHLKVVPAMRMCHRTVDGRTWVHFGHHFRRPSKLALTKIAREDICMVSFHQRLHSTDSTLLFRCIPKLLSIGVRQLFFCVKNGEKVASIRWFGMQSSKGPIIIKGFHLSSKTASVFVYTHF